MNASEAIEAVRDADPAANLPPAEPGARDALLARIVAAPAPAPAARPARRRGLRLALAPVAICALAACIALLQSGRSPDLAERAYAATNPRNGIIHEILETRWVLRSRVLGTSRGTERTELRIRPSGGTWRSVSPGVENAVGADGALRSWNSAEGRVHTMPAHEYRRRVAAGEPGFDRLGRDVIGAFRAAYERDGLRDAGVTTFAGQEVRRYTAVQRDFEQSWYISTATAVPVGTTCRASSARHGTSVWTTTVERHETLPPTAENIAELRFGH